MKCKLMFSERWMITGGGEAGKSEKEMWGREQGWSDVRSPPTIAGLKMEEGGSLCKLEIAKK